MKELLSKTPEKNHLGLLCDIGELNALFAGSDNIEAFLQQIVDMVAKHIHADVCSIYLFDDENQDLVLKATLGLNKKSINKARLKLGEGLVGLAVKEKRPICENLARQHPNFKLIPGINEKRFESLLVVPILRGIENIGALVVQRKKNKPFSDDDTMALKAITSQLAGAIEHTRILINLNAPKQGRPEVDVQKGYKLIKAEVASEGLALAKLAVISEGKPYRVLTEYESKKHYTVRDFERAVARTEVQLEDFQAKVEEKVTGDASLIFGSHILMLKDPGFTMTMIRQIMKGENPPNAIIAVADRYIQKFSASGNSYTKEKAKDVEDLTRRLFNNLVAQDEEHPFAANWQGRIIIARELYPSDILKLSAEKVSGIILVTGGVTSHLSILARSLHIPMVIADNFQLLEIPDNTLALLDAELGNIYIKPNKKQIVRYNERKKTQSTVSKLVRKVKPRTFTKDGTRIRLMANINLLMDLKLANDLKSEGVGLYRTEFSFMVRNNFPTEEEQTLVYSSIMEQMSGKSINIRTLDIGGDKVLAYYENAKENNPTLGMRSIRFSLSHKDIFQQQLRAILRAGADAANISITFPMISSVDEFREAKDAVVTCIKSLEKEGLPHYANPEIGLMVETPSVIEIIETLASEADFFCIGTNDFVQYMLAVDRGNAMVSSYYIPHHPAILRSLNKVVAAAKRYGKGVSICGEMAHEIAYIPFLVGIGIRTLSIDPSYMLKVQETISKISTREAEVLAEAVLKQNTIEGVRASLPLLEGKSGAQQS